MYKYKLLFNVYKYTLFILHNYHLFYAVEFELLILILRCQLRRYKTVLTRWQFVISESTKQLGLGSKYYRESRGPGISSPQAIFLKSLLKTEIEKGTLS